MIESVVMDVKTDSIMFRCKGQKLAIVLPEVGLSSEHEKHSKEWQADLKERLTAIVAESGFA